MRTASALLLFLPAATPFQKHHLFLNSTLCADRCQTDCRSYETPMNGCYNGQILFPHDESWGGADILDVASGASDSSTFQRRFFASTNGTCGGPDPTDELELPLEECVGPFGKPRPWRTFSINFE